MRRELGLRLSSLLAVAGLLFLAQRCHAGAKVHVGRPVAAGERISIDRIDHGDWDTLAKKYVDDRGRVDYTTWKKTDEDVAALDAYLGHLSQAEPRTRASRQAKLAFWINAYNAVTVRGILREYPTTSIRNHTAKDGGYNIWKDLLLAVGDAKYSLDEIEHKILRKLDEPRIHFAIVCAAHSCPRLLNEAYTARKLEEQLVANAKDFFANSENFRFDVGGWFHLSKILEWFGGDFGRTQADQLRAIAPYLPTEAARKAAASGRGRVAYLEYDWSLNDQKTAEKSR